MKSLKTSHFDRTKFKEFDPTEGLRDPDKILKILIECLCDNDPDAFKEILWAHLDIVHKEKFSKKSKIARRTLYRMLSPEGNPTLDNIAKMFHALKHP